MIPRRGLLAGRFEAAALRLGRHKAAQVSVSTERDYGNLWSVMMLWGAGATCIRNAVMVRPLRRRRRGGKPSPERMAMQAVKALAAWRRRKRVMRKRRVR